MARPSPPPSPAPRVDAQPDRVVTNLLDLPEAGRRRAEWRVSRFILAGSVIGSTIFGWFMASDPGQPWIGALQGAINAALVTLPIIWLELRSARRGVVRLMRRLPFGVFILLKTLVYLALIVPSVQLLRWLFSHVTEQSTGFDAAFVNIMLFAGSMSLLANIMITLGQLLGFPVLWRLLTGAYHRPRREERIFLSIDLKDSTAIAEQLGGERFYAFLNAFLADVAEGAFDTSGEIYKYVGDEVLLTWPASTGLADARCLLCPLAVRRNIARRAAYYQERFGAVPEFRAALHIGDVVTGEIGDSRREIGYFGDALNTTARLAAAAKELGRDMLVSGEVLQRLTVPKGLDVSSLPPLALRGKAAALPIATYELT